MARIRYYDYLKAIRDVLDVDTDLQNLHVKIEIGKAIVTAAQTPHVNVTEISREPMRPAIAAGTLSRYRVRWKITVSAFSAAGFEDAMQQRDEVLGIVEVVMMKNRDLGGILPPRQLTLEGGSLQSAPGEAGGFWAQADLDLSAEIQFSTT